MLRHHRRVITIRLLGSRPTTLNFQFTVERGGVATTVRLSLAGDEEAGGGANVGGGLYAANAAEAAADVALVDRWLAILVHHEERSHAALATPPEPVPEPQPQLPPGPLLDSDTADTAKGDATVAAAAMTTMKEEEGVDSMEGRRELLGGGWEREEVAADVWLWTAHRTPQVAPGGGSKLHTFHFKLQVNCD